MLPEGNKMADQTLDTKGLNCPLPILKAKKTLQGMPKGATLEILATDPGSVADFEAFCRSTKNTLVEQSEAAGVYRFLIQHTS
jgi:tRNA 2-thiouridine synthesizing protein A